MSDFTQLGEQIGNLVAQKQEAYGDSYGKSGQVLRILYPDGVRVDQYDAFLAVTRVIDKLFRVATKKDAFGESPWRDIAGYALLGIAADEKGPVRLVKGSFGHATEEELIDPRQKVIYDCLSEYAREYKIPFEIPANDETALCDCGVGLPHYEPHARPMEIPAPDAEVDFAGLRIIRAPCCAHPERGICDGGESEERLYDPCIDEPRYEFIIPAEPPEGEPYRAPFEGREVFV